jgi:hypothetical protein
MDAAMMVTPASAALHIMRGAETSITVSKMGGKYIF